MATYLNIQDIRASVRRRIKVLEFAANRAKQVLADDLHGLDAKIEYAQNARIYQNQADELWRMLGMIENMGETLGMQHSEGMPEWLHALIHFCADYHSGQTSKGYKFLCRAKRKAWKMGCKNPLDIQMSEDAQTIYDELVRKYENKV